MPEPDAPPLDRVLARPETGARSIVDMAMGVDRQHPEIASGVAPPTPKAQLTRTVSSLAVPVPRGDWPKVVCGTKRIYRTYAHSWRDRFARLVPEGEEYPRPAVIYSQTGHAKRYDSALAVILSYRQEPLGAISADDLAAEGFPSIKQFRRYWRYRYVRWGYRPMDLISVVELRPWQDGDDEEQAAWALRRLYGGLL